MEKWHNRVAVVTGAGVGIGNQVTKDLVNAGLIVIGLSTIPEKVEVSRSSNYLNKSNLTEFSRLSLKNSNTHRVKFTRANSTLSIRIQLKTHSNGSLVNSKQLTSS